MIALPHVQTTPERVKQRDVDCSYQSSALLLVHMQSARGVSEVLGQSFVDSVLQLGFQRVQSALREKDRCYALESNQLVILLHSPGTDEDAGKIAERLVDLLQRAYVVQGQMLYLHCWIGVTLAGEEGAEQAKLLEQARAALKFAVLEDPGSIIFFDGKLGESIRTRQSLTAHLRKALPLRQFQVFYQPQVELPTCQLVGFEALLRWNHPVLGWVSPADFIPLAEELGIISKIGDWVLRTACRQAAALPEGITMAVNASPLQLKNHTLSEAVQAALAGSGLRPQRLEIEITEGVLLERSGGVRSTLDDLHALGVRLAIDDFGTGYSSLGQLANLPFDCIKIDRSLVGTGSKSRAIVRAIAMLGAGLGLSTLIEGIETQQELEIACHDQCTLAQGFLFGRAVPAKELSGVLSRLSRSWSPS